MYVVVMRGGRGRWRKMGVDVMKVSKERVEVGVKEREKMTSAEVAHKKEIQNDGHFEFIWSS